MIGSIQDYTAAIQARVDLVKGRETENSDASKAAYDAAIQSANDYIAALKVETPNGR